MARVKIGIIGCGKQAPKHIRGLRSIDDVDIVVCDARVEAAEALAAEAEVPWVSSVDDVLGAADVDAVVIATPTATHAELIGRAVEAGKHFLCEKPMADSAEQARQLAQLAEDRDVIGMVGFIYRFAHPFQVGKKVLDGVQKQRVSPVLGTISTASLRIGGRGSHQTWKHRKAEGGGAVNEMLVHMLDLAIWYFGPVRGVEVLESSLLRPRRRIGGSDVKADAEDYVLVRLRHGSGLRTYCQADFVTPAFTQYVEIQGDNGTMMASIQSEMPSFIYCDTPRDGWTAGRNEIQAIQGNLYGYQHREFVEAVRAGVRPRLCTLDESVQVLQLAELIKSQTTDEVD